MYLFVAVCIGLNIMGMCVIDYIITNRKNKSKRKRG